MNEDLKKTINKGRLNKKAIIFIVVIIVLFGFYFFFYDGSEQRNLIYNNVESLAVSKNQIESNKKNPNSLLYKDFVTIQGKNYQIRLNNNRFEVLKDDKWVPIEDIVGKNGTIIMKDGRLLFVTSDGKTIALDTGDILVDDGELKQVDDGELSSFENERLYLKNGDMKYLTDDGEEVGVKNDDIISIDGKAYKMVDGVLKNIGGLFNSFVAKKNPKTGKIEYFRKNLKGDLVPVSEDQLKNGSLVEMDGKEYEYFNGNLVPHVKEYIAKRDKDGNLKYYLKGDETDSEIPSSKLRNGDLVELDGEVYEWLNGELKPIPKEIDSIDGLDTVGDYDYIVEEEKGKPAYYQKIGNKWAKVNKDDIPSAALIYYNNKPVLKSSDGKLKEFVPSRGKGFIKATKAYTVGKNGALIPLNNGDILAKDDKNFIVNDGEIEPLNKDNSKVHVTEKGLAFVDGKAYLLGKDNKKKLITEGEIVFRGGKPYKYINGRFELLSLDEYEAIKKIQKTKLKEEEKENKNSKSLLEPTPINNKNSVVEVTNDDIFYQAYSASADITTITSKKNKNDEINGIKNNDNQADLLRSNLFAGMTQDQTPYQQQNNQAQKSKFLEDNKNDVVHKDDIEQTSPFTLLTGAIIDARLITGVNTDQPGNVWGMITRDVYDTKTGNYLLIPQGSTVMGVYNSEVTEGANTVLIVWRSVTLPDGRQINLNGLPGLNLQGFSGIEGEVDNHWYEMFQAVAGMSIFSFGIQYGAGLTTTGGDSLNALQLMGATIAQQLGELGIQVFQKILNRQPTIKLSAGLAYKIGITHNLVFSHAYKYGQSMELINRV